MEIFIATSIKSFDLNPTHPATKSQLPHQRNSTYRTQRKQSGERARARSATDEVGDKLQRSASGEQDKLAGGKQYVARAESSCEFLCPGNYVRCEALHEAAPRLGDDFEFAFSCNAPPAWKFCAAQSQERFDRESAQRADQA